MGQQTLLNGGFCFFTLNAIHQEGVSFQKHNNCNLIFCLLIFIRTPVNWLSTQGFPRWKAFFCGCWMCLLSVIMFYPQSTESLPLVCDIKSEKGGKETVCSTLLWKECTLQLLETLKRGSSGIATLLMRDSEASTEDRNDRSWALSTWLTCVLYWGYSLPPRQLWWHFIKSLHWSDTMSGDAATQALASVWVYGALQRRQV